MAAFRADRFGSHSWLAIVFALLWCTAAQAQAPTNERVMQIVRQAVGETGHSVVTMGSWVSGLRYGDPLLGKGSDHDMRLLLPAGTAPDSALKTWTDVRRRVTDLVTREFGPDADKVLKSINVYPPTQLMRGVEGEVDALERFRDLRTSPNLGYAGPPGSMPAEAAEGLYGPGATTWTQRYEEAAGRLVYKREGDVFVGMTDLTHFEEGRGVYTTSGMANTAAQWADKADEALLNGKGDKVAKYLERLERDVVKARDLQRMGIHGAARDELHALAVELRAHPDRLGELAGRVQKVLSRSKMETAILARVESSGVVQKAVLQAMLDGLDVHSSLSEAVRKASETVPLDSVLNGILAYIAVTEVSRAAGENDPAKALVAAAQFLSRVNPGLLAVLAHESIEAAKEAGYALMANSQEPFDLLAGIYTAGGRPDPNGTAYTLDQLVATYRDEARLRSFVYALAIRAASRNAGAATGAADARVADAILERCYPVILRAWRAKREMLAFEFKDLAATIRTFGPALYYSPRRVARDRATGKATVTVTADSTDPKFGAHRDRMVKILEILYGPGAFVTVTDRWESGGVEAAQANQRRYTFAEDGTHTVHLTEVIAAGGAAVPRDSPLTFRFEAKAFVDVLVGEKAAVVKAGPKLADLQKCNTVYLNVWFPEAETGLDGFAFREKKGYLNGLNNTGVRIRNNTERYTAVLGPVQWNGTSFTAKAVDDYVFPPGAPKVVTTITIQGEVNPEGTRVLKVSATKDVTYEERDGRTGAPYYWHLALTLLDVPLEGGLEGKAVAGHVTGISEQWFTPATSGNKWKLYGVNMDKLESGGDKARVSVAFGVEK